MPVAPQSLANLAPAWPKGQSGNKGGRPKGFKGLAREIQERTGDGRDLVEFALKVFKGEPLVEGGPTPKLELRWQALEWLSDRGFGKPVQSIDLNVSEGGPTHMDLRQATPEELAVLEKFALAQIAASGAPTPVAGVIDVPAE